MTAAAIVRRVFPTAGPAIESPAELDALYSVPTADWLRVNLISSIDGSLSGEDGTSGSLTRGVDRKVLGSIRRASDVVLIGASSVRAEGYVLPRSVPLAIVTASGDLTGHAIPDRVEPGRLLVLCPASTRQRVLSALPGAHVVPLADVDGRLPGGAIVAALRERGLRSIVCEGGPTLAGRLIADGQVDEVCLSTSPVIVGGGTTPFGTALARTATLGQLLIDDAGVSYARWSSIH